MGSILVPGAANSRWGLTNKIYNTSFCFKAFVAFSTFEKSYESQDSNTFQWLWKGSICFFLILIFVAKNLKVEFFFYQHRWRAWSFYGTRASKMWAWSPRATKAAVAYSLTAWASARPSPPSLSYTRYLPIKLSPKLSACSCLCPLTCSTIGRTKLPHGRANASTASTYTSSPRQHQAATIWCALASSNSSAGISAAASFSSATRSSRSWSRVATLSPKSSSKTSRNIWPIPARISSCATRDISWKTSKRASPRPLTR